MAQNGRYLDKAAECARMAKAATEPARCAELKAQERLWRQIARQIEEKEPRQS
jgi:hypothetical protein